MFPYSALIPNTGGCLKRIFKMLSSVIIICSLAFASSKPYDTEESNRQLLLSLNQDLLRSVDTQEGLPNPSVHLALRLSSFHNHAKESEHLEKLKNDLYNNIQTSLSNSQPVTGLLALYTLALRSSCYDLNTVTFTVEEKTETLLTHLKSQMEQEKQNIFNSQRPLTNYYQYSLGVLALCVSGIRVNSHVSNKLITAVQDERFTHGDGDSIDTYAMAGMALQCVKDSGSHVLNVFALDRALEKDKLLTSRRADGHIGNEFSTGLAIQALLAMGNQVEDYAASMEAIRRDARNNKYHNPMAISQILPALHQKSYVTLKNMDCQNEDNSLVLEPIIPDVALPSTTKVAIQVEVVMSSEISSLYSFEVPQGSSLLEALEILQGKNIGFTFEKETSLWGPFLSVVNGEKARQSDRRYWHLSSDGTALSEGVGDYKIQSPQKISIKNTAY